MCNYATGVIAQTSYALEAVCCPCAASDDSDQTVSEKETNQKTNSCISSTSSSHREKERETVGTLVIKLFSSLVFLALLCLGDDPSFRRDVRMILHQFFLCFGA